MLTLRTELNAIGISGARGIDLMLLRDQNRATVSESGGSGERASSQANEDSRSPNTVAPQGLTPQEKRVVAELQQIDRQVRDHERAHLAAGHGVITSTADFTYTYGPDGRAYAVAGEVGIDTSPERKPEDNIYKGQRIQAAALAPRDPSATDYRVAAIGSRMELQGRSDLAQQQFQELMAGQEAAAEKRAAERSESVPNTAAPPLALESNAVQAPSESRLLVQNAYATVADDSAAAGRVSVFA
ncbi:hypothetical protein RHDC4_02124 [Rhodocyclaceae bacterium]|nr:hypothetical protein RHDC4_02124 [Rhodocyclaceae bacterium]